jgi:hypothetical protein
MLASYRPPCGSASASVMELRSGAARNAPIPLGPRTARRSSRSLASRLRSSVVRARSPWVTLPMAPLPFRTSHRHGEPGFVVARITPSQRLQIATAGLLIQPAGTGHNDRMAPCLSRRRFISVSSSPRSGITTDLDGDDGLVELIYRFIPSQIPPNHERRATCSPWPSKQKAERREPLEALALAMGSTHPTLFPKGEGRGHVSSSARATATCGARASLRALHQGSNRTLLLEATDMPGMPLRPLAA